MTRKKICTELVLFCLIGTTSLAQTAFAQKKTASGITKGMPNTSEICPSCKGRLCWGRLTVLSIRWNNGTEEEQLLTDLDVYTCNLVGWVPKTPWSGDINAVIQREVLVEDERPGIPADIYRKVSVEGKAHGCYSCNRTEADLTKANVKFWTPDHSRPYDTVHSCPELYGYNFDLGPNTVQNEQGIVDYRFRPHCQKCSSKQGGNMGGFKQHRFAKWFIMWEEEDPRIELYTDKGTEISEPHTSPFKNFVRKKLGEGWTNVSKRAE